MTDSAKLILLTNDDGIHSPGLYAAAEALSALGQVLVVAPRLQSTGAGRSMPSTSSGGIQLHEQATNGAGKKWEMYAVDGAPAQAVQHGILEIAPRKPDLVVAGINYGENVGTGVTVSGTVGAALEAAAFGLPALAVSVETAQEYHLSYSTDINFAVAGHFTRFFAELLLNLPRQPDVDLWKVEVPTSATPATPWRVTRLSRQRYYLPVKPQRQHYSEEGRMGYNRDLAPGLEPDSDVAALVNHQIVSLTPLSLDLTSRIDLAAWEKTLRNSAS